LKENFIVNEHCFKQIPSDSLVVLDDYLMHNITQQAKLDFLKIVNYTLRHQNICLIIVIHNLYNVGLYNNILLSPHLFISYTNLGFYILRYVLAY